MEGIRDGQPVDSCFHCALLYPDADDCPHCGKRLHYQPASMMSAEEIEERSKTLIAAFRSCSGPAEAEALLRHLHQHQGEISLRPGEADCPTIEALRLAYEK